MTQHGDTAELNLDICAQEPIRIPGGIQPHGAVLVLGEGMERLQASTNLEAFTGMPIGPGERLADKGGARLAEELRSWIAEDSSAPFLRTVEVSGRPLQVNAHRGRQGLLVEFEDPPASASETLEALYPRLRRFVERLEGVNDVSAIAGIVVREIREMTGFNRVMLYSFDNEGSGTVLAEDLDEALPPYLELRFPASDIPAQARELYRLNRLRIIPDANYQPVLIEPLLSPIDNQPLDLSFAALRSVSPVHLEYMRNMGTLTSMSISILVDGRLWGLISCHNAEPKGLNAQVRSACDFVGQIVSLQIGSRERGARAADRMALKRIESELLARLAVSPTFQEGLAANAALWMQLVNATGAALVMPTHTISVGTTPSQPELLALAAWLHQRQVEEVFETDSLAAHWRPAEAFAGVASGLLAISISQLHSSYILWFREEAVRTVKWAGEPTKPATLSPDRLHPRQSFALWKEHVRLRSLPWLEVEVESGADFRNAILNFVLRRAEEKAELSEKLHATNKELEAFSYSVSHDLRAPFRHIVGYSELLGARLTDLDEKSRHYLASIIDAALSAGRLVDDLLNFSQLGRSSLNKARVDVRKIVEEVRLSMQMDLAGRRIEWRVGELPPAWGDPAMLRQVFANLIDNAVKYSAGRDPAVISVEAVEVDEDTRYTVSDNGVGFDMKYSGKLFGVFQRLHRAEDFPGTGIGLALTKRIVERHGGSVFAEAVPEQGATIGFTLPTRKAKTLG